MKTAELVTFLLLIVVVSSRDQPKDWIKPKESNAVFSCEGVGNNVTSYKWFQVLYGFFVVDIPSSNEYYRVNDSNLEVIKNGDRDRDVFCEAQGTTICGDIGRWRSRKAQLRMGLRDPPSNFSDNFRNFTPLKVGSADTAPIQEVYEGDNLHLSCNFTDIGQNRSRKVQWLLNGKRVPKGGESFFTETTSRMSVLYIKGMNSALHSGVYQCMVEKCESSWQPLLKPFWPLKRNESMKKLPFFDYDIATAGIVTTKEFNRHAPKIISVKGLEFAVFVDDKTSVIDLTTVIVSDSDSGRAGGINCSILCDTSRCPHFNMTSSDQRPKSLSSDNGPLRTVISADVSDRSDKLPFNLSCTDFGKEPKRTQVSFSVSLTKRKRDIKELSKITKKLMEFEKKNVKQMNVNQTAEFVGQLEEVTKEVETFIAVDVILTTTKTLEVVTKLSKSREKEKGVQKAGREKVLKQVTQLISNTLKVDKKVMIESQEKGNVASQTLDTIDKLLTAVAVAANDTKGKTIKTDNLAIAAVSVSSEREQIITFASRTRNTTDVNIIIGDDSEEGVAISLRSDLVIGTRVEFAMYNDATLFEAMKKDSNRRVVSPVLSARAVLKKQRGGEAPVRLRFNTKGWDNGTAGAKFFCGFWKPHNQTWDTAGCNSNRSEGEIVNCSCSHLTNFALLLDLEPDAKPISIEHHLALSFMTYFFLTLSCLALGLTIGIYCTYLRKKQASSRSGQKSSAFAVTRSKVLMSLCGTLFLAHFTFLVTSFHDMEGYVCTGIAVLLHLSYLSVFFWSVVEGMNVFFMIIYMELRSDRLKLDNSRFFLKGTLFAWGLPVLIVIATAAATRFDGYGPVYEDAADPNKTSLCFVQKNLPFYLAFLMPLVVCLLVNIVISGLLAFVFVHRSGGLTARQKSRVKSKMIGFASICITLNLTWIFGLLHFGPIKVAMYYLFVIFNGLQGVLIFTFCCLLREEMRKHLTGSFQWMRFTVGTSESYSTTTSQYRSSRRKLSNRANDYKEEPRRQSDRSVLLRVKHYDSSKDSQTHMHETSLISD